MFSPQSALAGAAVGGVIVYSAMLSQRKSSPKPASVVANKVGADSSASSLQDHPALKFGVPESPISMHINDTFVTAFDRRLRTALYSCEHLNKSRKRSENVERERSVFFSPPNEEFCPSNEDYLHSGYDRGHLVPA